MVVLLSACGGGGGSDISGACSVLKIAGGESCTDGQPNVAYILTEKAGRIGNCTGAYVSLTSVLTAAHCFLDPYTKVNVASNGNIRTGVSVTIHPLYDGSVESPFDIAIVKVDAPLANQGPLPIMLSREPQQGEDVFVFGYGTDETGEVGIERIQSGAAPLKAASNLYAGFSDGTETIVSIGGGSPCPGDSGGPVVARGTDGRYGIFGITRAGPNGCVSSVGRAVALSSTQTNGAINFLSALVPDLAVN